MYGKLSTIARRVHEDRIDRALHAREITGTFVSPKLLDAILGFHGGDSVIPIFTIDATPTEVTPSFPDNTRCGIVTNSGSFLLYQRTADDKLEIFTHLTTSPKLIPTADFPAFLVEWCAEHVPMALAQTFSDAITRCEGFGAAPATPLPPDQRMVPRF